MRDWPLQFYYELVKVHVVYLNKYVFYRFSAFQAGLKKRFLSLDNDKNITFCYYEKGSRVPGQSSMIFIHGFSSSKEAWCSLIEVSLISICKY